MNMLYVMIRGLTVDLPRFSAKKREMTFKEGVFTV